jgi:hypothetical protein
VSEGQIDPVETLTDNDLVHVHKGPRAEWWWGTLLVVDMPTSLLASERDGLIDISTRWLNRAEITFNGPVCFDCERERTRER